MVRVSIKKAGEYDPLILSRKLEEALDEIGSILPSKSKVLIKPNIVSVNRPRQCTTTHPSVIEALCMLLADKGCSVVIGESSAFYQGGYTDKGFSLSGMREVARRFGAELVAFEQDGAVLADNRAGKVLDQILISRRVGEADFIISAGKLKTHVFAGMTGAVKNLFGFVPGGTKFEYHFLKGYGREIFGEKIADLYGLIRPGLSVLDGIYGLEGAGPSAMGKPRKSGILLVSANGYALDSVAARIIGIDPEENEILRTGIARGYLSGTEEITLTGDFPQIPSIPFKLPEKSTVHDRDDDLLYKLVAVLPFPVRRKCTGCGICSDQCPLSAITVNGTVNIDRNNCLRCYHCHYVCPEKAIVLKGVSPLNMPARALRKFAGL